MLNIIIIRKENCIFAVLKNRNMLEKFDIENAKAAMLYILSKLGKTDFIHLFKILYFAERKCLCRCGHLIVDDKYIAMRKGPVPSTIYDLFKNIRNGTKEDNFFNKSFLIYENHFVEAIESPDMDCLSVFDVECLDESIKENKDLDSDTLSEKSHDYAWKNSDINEEIDIINIAKAEGASEEMIDYIKENIEISKILGCV